MNYDLVLNPLQIGNGMITRSEIMDMIISAGKNNQLDPLETLRFYREIEKAAGEAVKAIDPAYEKSIEKAAADFAETLPAVQEVLADGKKEFEYKNCRYQYKENREALILVDGIEMSDISGISPNDVERVDVLKDASAMSTYGMRGANGVVLITTRKSIE